MAREIDRDKLPEFKVDPLESEVGFQKWFYVLGAKFRSYPYSKDIFEGNVTFVVTEEGLDVQKEGAVLTAEQRKKYLQAEEQMKAIMVQALAEEYALPLLGLDRFQEKKTRLSQVILGKMNIRLMVVSQKIRRLKFKRSIKQFIKFTRSLSSEYRILAGSMSPQEIANFVLDPLPNYLGYLKYEFRQKALEAGFEVKSILNH